MRSRPSLSWSILGVMASLTLSAPASFAQAPVTQQPPPPATTTRNTSDAEGFGVQIGGGPIFANFADTQNLNLESKAGWLFGILMGGNRSGTVGVEADVLYGKKGVTLSNVALDTHVIHVPVMLKLNGGSRDAEGLSFFGLGGGFFDWQFKNTLGGVDISDDTTGYEVGWVVGGGIEVVRVSVQARYMRGIRQIARDFNVGQSVDSDSTAFAVLVAFRLN